MYAPRQNKEKVLRTFSMDSYGNAQRYKIVDNRKYKTFDKRDVVQCNVWDLISGGSSIVGGMVSMITGGRDYINANKDITHNTYSINGSNLSINAATGTLEQVGNENDNEYKVKVTGKVLNVPRQNNNTHNTMPGATSRAYEGLLNGLSGLLNLGAGALSLANHSAIAAVMFGAGALSSGGAALLRYFRSRSSQKQEAPSAQQSSYSAMELPPNLSEDILSYFAGYNPLAICYPITK